MSKEPRVGVFVCHCGLNITGVIDVRKLTEYATFSWSNNYKSTRTSRGEVIS